MGDKPDCGNYKGISLLATAYTILYNILISYLILHIDEITGNSNVYFDVLSQLLIWFCMRQILENKWEYNVTARQLFIDFENAYDSVVTEKYCTMLSLNMV
jgi:hypothetical protein